MPPTDCASQERLAVARLHIAGFRRRGGPRAGASSWNAQTTTPTSTRSTARSGTLSIGVVRARSIQTPARRRPAGLHHRLRPAVLDAAAGVAGPRRAPTCSKPTPSSPSTGAAWACRARSTAGTSSTARRCTTRRNSNPATIRSPTSRTSPTPRPRTAPTPSRPAPRPTTIRTPPPTSNDSRSLWDVPAVALVGIGNGAQVALAYAASRPDRVARLILDSPVALGVDAEAAAEQQVKGQQAALDAFAAQCVGGELPAGSRSERRRQRAAGRCPRRPRAGGASVAAGGQRHQRRLGLPLR